MRVEVGYGMCIIVFGGEIGVVPVPVLIAIISPSAVAVAYSAFPSGDISACIQTGRNGMMMDHNVGTGRYLMGRRRGRRRSEVVGGATMTGLRMAESTSGTMVIAGLEVPVGTRAVLIRPTVVTVTAAVHGRSLTSFTSGCTICQATSLSLCIYVHAGQHHDCHQHREKYSFACHSSKY